MSTPLPLSPFIQPKKPTSIDDVLHNLSLELLPNETPALAEEPMPAFLANPSPDYLRALDCWLIVKVLGEHMR